MAAEQKTAKKTTVLVEGNLEVHPDFALLALNPALFPLPVVYAASRKVLDKVYVLIDGDPNEEIVVELRQKKKGVKLLDIGRDFGNLLLNELEQYHQHTLPALDSFAEAIVDTGGNEEPVHEQPQQAQEPEKEMSYHEDPLGIMKPWGEETK